MALSALLQSDGGSRGNPGIAGIGFSIACDGEIVCRGGWYIGTATNNVAEYKALIWGLENARALGVTELEIRADSELMVKQIQGAYKVKNAGLKPLFIRAMELLRQFDSFSISHVFRSDNSVPDSMANQAMDALAPVGDYRVEFAPEDLFSL